MDDKKKRFVIPVADIVDFANNDIITSSIASTNDALDWGEETDIELWVED